MSGPGPSRARSHDTQRSVVLDDGIDPVMRQLLAIGQQSAAGIDDRAGGTASAVPKVIAAGMPIINVNPNQTTTQWPP